MSHGGIARDLTLTSLPNIRAFSSLSLIYYNNRILQLLYYNSSSNAFNLSYLRPVIVLFIVNLLRKPVIACLVVLIDLLIELVD